MPIVTREPVTFKEAFEAAKTARQVADNKYSKTKDKKMDIR